MWNIIKILFVFGFIALFITIIFVCISIVLIKTQIEDVEFLKSITAQVIGGLVAGIIGFLSAISFYYFRDWQEVKDKRKEAFTQIYNEVGENRYSLMLELRRERPSVNKRRLITEAWQRNKYIAPLWHGKLIEGLKILYGKIDQYNFSCRFYEHLVLWRKMTPKQIFNDTVKQIDKAETQKIYDDLIRFERILAKESILLGYSKKKDWPFNDCSPEDDFAIPYFVD